MHGEDAHSELPVDPDSGIAAPLTSYLLVAAGGAAGTLGRYGLAQLFPTAAGWPLATFFANIVGAFVLGALLEGLVFAPPGARERWRLAAGTGFCGAFTTYSAVAVEANLLARDGRTALAILYGAVTVIAGFAATLAGIALMSRRGVPRDSSGGAPGYSGRPPR